MFAPSSTLWDHSWWGRWIIWGARDKFQVCPKSIILSPVILCQLLILELEYLGIISLFFNVKDFHVNFTVNPIERNEFKLDELYSECLVKLAI